MQATFLPSQCTAKVVLHAEACREEDIDCLLSSLLPVGFGFLAARHTASRPSLGVMVHAKRLEMGSQYPRLSKAEVYLSDAFLHATCRAPQCLAVPSISGPPKRPIILTDVCDCCSAPASLLYVLYMLSCTCRPMLACMSASGFMMEQLQTHALLLRANKMLMTAP